MNAIRPSAETSWIKRHMVLFVTSLVTGVVILAGGIVVLVLGLIKSSDPYQRGFAKAAADTAVVDAIGSPIEAGMFVTGSIRESGSSGQADLSIPVHAPKGAGNVYLHAKRSLGEWTLTALVFENDATHERTDLLHQDGKAAP